MSVNYSLYQESTFALIFTIEEFTDHIFSGPKRLKSIKIVPRKLGTNLPENDVTKRWQSLFTKLIGKLDSRVYFRDRFGPRYI